MAPRFWASQSATFFLSRKGETNPIGHQDDKHIPAVANTPDAVVCRTILVVKEVELRASKQTSNSGEYIVKIGGIVVSS